MQLELKHVEQRERNGTGIGSSCTSGFAPKRGTLGTPGICWNQKELAATSLSSMFYWEGIEKLPQPQHVWVQQAYNWMK